MLVTFLACSHPFIVSHNKFSVAKLYNTAESSLLDNRVSMSPSPSITLILKLSVSINKRTTIKLWIEASSVYKYKWIRPPACMWGLAFIATCQLCVILFKNQAVCTITGILFIFTMHENIGIYRISNKISSIKINRQSNLPRLVCRTRFVIIALLLSVQMNQTPGLCAGPGIYPGPSFYPKFYDKLVNNNHLVHKWMRMTLLVNNNTKDLSRTGLRSSRIKPWRTRSTLARTRGQGKEGKGEKRKGGDRIGWYPRPFRFSGYAHGMITQLLLTASLFTVTPAFSKVSRTTR